MAATGGMNQGLYGRGNLTSPVRLNDFYEKPAGLIERGNIDLTKRPIVKNPDGSISTVRSMGVNIDNKEYLLPTVSDDGRIMTDQEAIDSFMKSGKHLGAFETPDQSTDYAKKLHDQQAVMYGWRK